MTLGKRGTNATVTIAGSIVLGLALMGATPARPGPKPTATPQVVQDVNPLAPPIRETVLVTGRVTARGKPVTHANVRLVRGGNVVANTLTGSDGSYRFADAAPGSGVPPTISAGVYSLEAQYRANTRAAGTVSLQPGRTQQRNIELGDIVRLGGAAPPPPRTTFLVTDRTVNAAGTSVDNAFTNDRPIAACQVSAACMHFAFVSATGPILAAPAALADLNGFVAAMRTAYPTADTAIVFVHGFNNDFGGPARLTAGVVASLAPDAVPIVYSWPSKHATARYIDDESNNQWDAEHFRDFLVGLLSAPDAPKTVHIIAHSMGSRVVLAGLQYLGNAKPALSGRIGQVVFAAPDIDATTFWEGVPAMSSVARGVTVYSSAHDEALQLSRLLHGHCRAGLTGCNDAFLLPPNVNAVDSSFFRCDILGHGYWSASTTIVADITQMMKSGVMSDTALRPNIVAQGSNRFRFGSATTGDSGCAAEPRD